MLLLLHETVLFIINFILFIYLSLLNEKRRSQSRLVKLKPHVGRSTTIFQHVLWLYLDFLFLYASLRFIIVVRCHVLEAQIMLIINLMFVAERFILIGPH